MCACILFSQVIGPRERLDVRSQPEQATITFSRRVKGPRPRPTIRTFASSPLRRAKKAPSTTRCCPFSLEKNPGNSKVLASPGGGSVTVRGAPLAGFGLTVNERGWRLAASSSICSSTYGEIVHKAADRLMISRAIQRFGRKERS